jgi:hypothetical protein
MDICFLTFLLAVALGVKAAKTDGYMLLVALKLLKFLRFLAENG